MKKKIVLLAAGLLIVLMIFKLNQKKDYSKEILGLPEDISVEDLEQRGYVDISPPMASMDPKLEKFIQTVSYRGYDVFKYYYWDEDLIIGYLEYREGGDYIGRCETSRSSRYLEINTYGKMYTRQKDDQLQVIGLSINVSSNNDDSEPIEDIFTYINK